MSIKPVLNVVGVCRFPAKDISTGRAVELIKRLDDKFNEQSADLPVNLSYITEITFSSDNLPEILDGARNAGVRNVIVGTVTNTDRLETASRLGVEKAVAPDSMLDVLLAAKEYKIEFTPGITHHHERRELSEMITANHLPIPKVLKVFPFAGEKTPQGLLNALKAPYAAEITAFEASGGKIRLASDGEVSHNFVYSPTGFATQLRERTGQEVVIGKPYSGMDGIRSLYFLKRFDFCFKGTEHGAFGGVKLTDVGNLSTHGVEVIGLGSDFLGSDILRAANSGDFTSAVSNVDALIGSIRAAYTK